MILKGPNAPPKTVRRQEVIVPEPREIFRIPKLMPALVYSGGYSRCLRIQYPGSVRRRERLNPLRVRSNDYEINIDAVLIDDRFERPTKPRWTRPQGWNYQSNAAH